MSIDANITGINTTHPTFERMFPRSAAMRDLVNLHHFIDTYKWDSMAQATEYEMDAVFYRYGESAHNAKAPWSSVLANPDIYNMGDDIKRPNIQAQRARY